MLVRKRVKLDEMLMRKKAISFSKYEFTSAYLDQSERRIDGYYLKEQLLSRRSRENQLARTLDDLLSEAATYQPRYQH